MLTSLHHVTPSLPLFSLCKTLPYCLLWSLFSPSLSSLWQCSPGEHTVSFNLSAAAEHISSLQDCSYTPLTEFLEDKSGATTLHCLVKEGKSL